jgi:plastocyanin
MQMHYRLALVAALIGGLVACGSSNNTMDPSTPTPTTGTPQALNAVSIPNIGGYGPSSFQPGAISVALNTAVTWNNMDQQEHFVQADDNTFSGDLPAGGSTSNTFKTAGSFSYHCAIHPTMTGQVTVGSSAQIAAARARASLLLLAALDGRVATYRPLGTTASSFMH